MNTKIYLYMKLFFFSGSSYIMCLFAPLNFLQAKNTLSFSYHFLKFQIIERSKVKISHSLL